MNCSNALQLLHLNRPGERSTADETALQTHLAGCPSCAAWARRIDRLADVETAWRTAETPVPDLRHIRARVLAATSHGRRPRTALPDLSLFFGARGITRLAYAVISLALVGWFIAGQTNVRMARSRLHENTMTPLVRTGGPRVVYAVDPASVASVLPSNIFPFQGKIEVSQSEVEDWMRLTERELRRAALQGPDRRARLDTVVRTLRSSVTVTIRFRTPGV